MTVIITPLDERLLLGSAREKEDPMLVKSGTSKGTKEEDLQMLAATSLSAKESPFSPLYRRVPLRIVAPLC